MGPPNGATSLPLVVIALAKAVAKLTKSFPISVNCWGVVVIISCFLNKVYSLPLLLYYGVRVGGTLPFQALSKLPLRIGCLNYDLGKVAVSKSV